MKLGTFIVAALCAATSSAAAGTHDKAIEQYRAQYEQQSDPHLLTLIADEYRAAGQVREALDYYCSYMYVDAAGDDADHASENARALAVKVGRSGATDHEACDAKSKAAAAPSVTGVQALDLNIPPPPARITKREIVGLSMLAMGVGGFGMALYEGRELARVRKAQQINDPTVDADELAAQGDAHVRNQKLWLLGGGVTLVTGGIMYALGRHDRKTQDARALAIGPTATKGGGGLVVGGRF
jgi:hypothetical protein